MKRAPAVIAVLALAFAAANACFTPAQAVVAREGSDATKQLVILDTDIGDDIDDAFALAFVLRSPEVKILGITTEFGDTALRSRLVGRYLAAVNRSDIPIAVGRATPHSNVFTQAVYAERGPHIKYPDGVQFLLDQIRAHPGQVTIISIGPMVNLGDAIKRDPAVFRKVKRVVLMGGSVYRGYDTAQSNHTPPQPEWNIARDPAGAKALFTSGVPIYMMPLDSTQLKMGEVLRNTLFSQGTQITDALTLLYQQWTASTQNPTPTLFDAMAVAYAIDPGLCPTQPMRIVVDEKGYTRATPGEPNANVCLNSDSDKFFHFYMHTVLNPDTHATTTATDN